MHSQRLQNSSTHEHVPAGITYVLEFQSTQMQRIRDFSLHFRIEIQTKIIRLIYKLQNEGMVIAEFTKV